LNTAHQKTSFRSVAFFSFEKSGFGLVLPPDRYLRPQGIFQANWSFNDLGPIREGLVVDNWNIGVLESVNVRQQTSWAYSK